MQRPHRGSWPAMMMIAAATALAGCGDDGGAATDARTVDADPDLVNGCTRTGAADRTAAGAERTIVQDGVAYLPSCMRIKAGQAVTWDANFVAHPLASGSPSGGPQPGSPITETMTGTTKTFTFPGEGVFGFWCEEHGRAMMGAIYVEP